MYPANGTRLVPSSVWPPVVRNRTLTIAAPLTLISVVVLLAVPRADSRMLAAVALLMVNIAAWFVVALWNRDGAIPAFELGPILIAVTVLYASYPILAFLMSGSTWTAISDNRLRHWNPDAEALSGLAWGQVGYIAAFAVVYLAVRGRASAGSAPVRMPTRRTTIVLFWLLSALSVYFAALWLFAGVTFDPTYSDVREGLVATPGDLPYVVQQISHNLRGILVVVKLCVMAVLLSRWRSRPYRLALCAWLAFEVASTALRMGARSEAMTLLMAAGLLYHRLVRPLRPRTLVLAAVVLLGAALFYGFARDFVGNRQRSAGAESYWSAANEFQILLGTAYDLKMRRERGAIERVPWQVYATDAVLLIPSQLLPVEKVEPDRWYLDLLGNQPAWAGLMFGVTAQAVLGWGWIELIVRGALLGALCALFHRWYVRRASAFWASILYLYVCLWAYYTFRASSLYVLYFVLYRFVPTMLFVRIASGVLRRAAYAEAHLNVREPS